MTTPPSGEVTIGGRTFTLGTVYEPAPHVRPYEQGRLLPLRLGGHHPAHPRAEGRGPPPRGGGGGGRLRGGGGVGGLGTQPRGLPGGGGAGGGGEPVGDVGR